MKQPPATLYLGLAILGAILPCIFFIDYLAGGGSLAGFVAAAFGNGVAGGLAVDLLVSSVVFWILAIADSRRRDAAAPWPFVVVNLTIGLSCALPLYLWWRGRRAEPATQLSFAGGQVDSAQGGHGSGHRT